jgi:hypothetical protein
MAVFAILCADPLMFFMDFATIYLKKFKPSAESPKANCKLLSFQCFIAIVFIYAVAQSIWYCQIAIRYGRPDLIFMTFLFAWLVD